MTKPDRRVKRTRTLLQQSLIDLSRERGIDAITIQDIAERANVGRTTFYLHYPSKEDLLISCHAAMISEFHFGPLYPMSREEWLSPTTPPGIISAYRHLETVRDLLNSIIHSKNNALFLQRMRDENTREIKTRLLAAFPEMDKAIPLDIVATYLAGAQVAMFHWWLEKPRPHTPETVAHRFHRLQRAAICDAFGFKDETH
jgi:AcrR family transcriptional regulator